MKITTTLAHRAEVEGPSFKEDQIKRGPVQGNQSGPTMSSCSPDPTLKL